MLKTLINKLIRSLGKDGYQLDDAINRLDICMILITKFKEVVRGEGAKLFLKSSNGLLFIGKLGNHRSIRL